MKIFIICLNMMCSALYVVYSGVYFAE